MRTEPITVIVADDHPVYRIGLCEVINDREPFRVVGEASDGDSALELIVRTRPQVAILDVEMPGLSGIDVARRIDELQLPVSVVILTMHDERSVFNAAIDAGVRGYLLKDNAVLDILSCIDRVADGEYYISPALSNHLSKRVSADMAGSTFREQLAPLTTMEHEVLRRIAASERSRDIAEALHISVRTVENHRHHIMKKLEIAGSYALLRFALEHKGELGVGSRE